MRPIHLAKLCKISYGMDHKSKRSHTTVHSKSHTSTIRTRTDRQIIATRGSKDFEHVWTNVDLRTLPWNEDGIRFHRGFYRAAEHLWTELKPEIEGTHPLFFTGHSMGGAISIALARMAHEAKPDRPIRVVTFGSPRYGSEPYDPPFSIENFVLEHDLVVQIPQHMHHFGTTWVIPTKELPNPYRPYGIVRYHSIEHYIHRLSSAERAAESSNV